MEGFIALLGLNLAAVLAFMVFAWLLSLILQDASIADVFWGLGFILIAWITFFKADGFLWRRLILTVLPTVWGLRLAIYILWRNWGAGEDRRYQAWREKHGDRFRLVSLFTVFLTQAVLLWIISFGLQLGQLSAVPDRLTWLDGLGALVWVVGLTFETVGDWQLARFKANPENEGKVMNRGLWAYTRHPNYFGESLIWWGIFLVSMATPLGPWAVVSPVVITFLLLRVSGVTLMEKTITERRPEYLDYIRRTSPFIPWFPKRGEP